MIQELVAYFKISSRVPVLSLHSSVSMLSFIISPRKMPDLNVYKIRYIKSAIFFCGFLCFGGFMVRKAVMDDFPVILNIYATADFMAKTRN